MIYFKGRMKNAQGWVDSEYIPYSIGTYTGSWPGIGGSFSNIDLSNADFDQSTNVSFKIRKLNDQDKVNRENGYVVYVSENPTARIYMNRDDLIFETGGKYGSFTVHMYPEQYYGSAVFDTDDVNTISKVGSIYYRPDAEPPSFSILEESMDGIEIIRKVLLLNPYTPEPEETDPYAPGGSSGTGGGTGNFDGTGDDIAIPGLPTLSAVDTGLITLFNPSISQLKSLSNYLWSGFDLNTFKKIFANPMDCILGLSIVPVSVPNGELKEVSVGNIPTGVSMTVAASQYVIVDCGTLNVNEFWGAYLDYDPYTKAEIYLPYIGTHPLSVDDIMGKSVHVVYHIDILSGACTAFVKCGGSVLYEFIGQCSSSIPVTGNDWTNVINGVLSVSASIGTMVATGGATAPMAASAIASTAVNSMKSNVEKSGSMSGTGGMLAVQTPYLILTRPRQAMPARQNEFMGYPSFITSKLGSLSGYTVVEEIHLENISGTEKELSEIENLLKTGVIL